MAPLISVHWPFDKTPEDRKWDLQSYRRLCSIDPGITDLCIRFEVREMDENDNEVVRTEVSDIVDLTNGCKVSYSWKNQEVVSIYNRLNVSLDRYLSLLMTSHIIIVESQPLKGRNPGVLVAVTKVTQHVLAYLSIKLASSSFIPLIIEVDPKLKYINNNYPTHSIIGDKKTKLVKATKKKHSTALALELLASRGDDKGLESLRKAKAKHKDDMADTIMQLEGVLVEIGWPSRVATSLRSGWNTLRS